MISLDTLPCSHNLPHTPFILPLKRPCSLFYPGTAILNPKCRVYMIYVYIYMFYVSKIYLLPAARPLLSSISPSLSPLCLQRSIHNLGNRPHFLLFVLPSHNLQTHGCTVIGLGIVFDIIVSAEMRTRGKLFFLDYLHASQFLRSISFRGL